MTQNPHEETRRRLLRFLSAAVAGVLLASCLAVPSHAYAFFELRDSQGNKIADSDSSSVSIDVNDLQAGIELVFDWQRLDAPPNGYGLETFTVLKDSTGKDVLDRVESNVFDVDGMEYVSLKYSLKALDPDETYTFSFLKRRNDNHTLLEKVGDITIGIKGGKAEEEPGATTGSGDDESPGEEASAPEDPPAAAEPVVIAPGEVGGNVAGGLSGAGSGVVPEPSGAAGETGGAAASAAAIDADGGTDADAAAARTDASKAAGAKHAAPADDSGSSLASMGDVYKFAGSGVAGGAGAATPALTVETTGFPRLLALLLGALLLSGPFGLCWRFAAFRRRLAAASRIRAGGE